MVKRHSIIERRQLELFYRANPKNAGVLNHEGFYVVDWAKGIAMPDPYSPYDDDGASLYKAELEPTIQREENESIQDYADRLTQQRLEQRSIIEKMYRPDMSLKERAELFQKEIESYSGVNIADQWLYSMKRDDGSRGYVLMRLDSGNYGNYLYISTLVRPQKLGAWSRELPRYIKQDFEGKGFAGDFLSWITAMSDYRQVPVLLRVHPFIPSHLGPFSKEGFYMRKDLEGTSCEVCEYDDWLDEEDMSEEELYQQGLWDSANGTWKYGGKLRLSEISGDSMKYTCELCGNYESAPWGPTNTREQLMDYYHQFGFQSAKPTKTKDFDFEPVVGGLDYRYGNMIHVPMERPKTNLLMRLRLMKKPVIERPKNIMSYKAEYKKGTKGPCWDGYTYVGDTPYSKGSCVKNAETFEAFTIGEITTEPMTVYRRMDWKQYYDGLELGYLHPMRTRMELRPDENIGGTWGIGQPQIWGAKNPNIYSGLSHLSGKTAKQLFEIDIPIGTRIKGGYDIQIFDSIPIENVRPFYLGDEEEYTHMAETKPPKTSKGLIVYPNRMAELIRDGDKQMIVKDKPLDIAGKRYTVVTNRKGYAYIQLGAMQTLTLPKFKALKDKHLITPEERVKYFKGKRRLYAWPVKVLREFDKAYPTNAPLRPQDIAPKLKTYASEETKAHDWELNGVGYDGETVSITCSECGHSDYAQCHIHQLEDLGKNDPKKPIIVRGKDACMNGVQEDCGECEGTGTCDPDFCYAGEGEPHCSLCKGTSICYYCEGTGLDPDVSEGDESHRWRLYAMPHLTHRDRQGVKIICEDCGVGDVFQAFVPSECLGFQGTCLCDFCESHRIDQLEKIDYVIF
tara:strand:+ start:4463 stop:7009 length:2547 start_codon:yes stop_codon:yes gene_type:complete